MTAGLPTSSRGPRHRLITGVAVGVDGFTGGRDAAALGHVLAEAADAELLLVAIHRAPFVPTLPELGYRKVRGRAQRELSIIHDSLPRRTDTTAVPAGSVPYGLARAAHRHHCELLVVGSSRQAQEGRVRIGHRTRRLLDEFGCAVAVAPRGMNLTAAHHLHRIGVGYDGGGVGTESGAAVAIAAALAAGAGAQLHVQSIVPGIAEAGVEALIRDELVTLAGRQRAALQLDVVQGRPADSLLALSETVDLLVIGSRRWGSPARLLGGVGEAILHDAACPVLTVPRQRR